MRPTHFTWFRGLWAQTVLVNDTVSGFIGTDVILHCSFTNPNPTNVKITQVTWQKATNGSKQNVAIFNPNMGVSVLPPYKERVLFQSPSTKDGTIRLLDLELDDEGVYICEFATFPSGNRENQLNLTVFGKWVSAAVEAPSQEGAVLLLLGEGGFLCAGQVRKNQGFYWDMLKLEGVLFF
uniref:Nectin-1 n=1 Tax=Sphaerodactylus townsendi TaxID=933632 RepID=A0ACB8EYM0_9SAUR